LLRSAAIKSIADAERRDSGHSGSRSGRHSGLLRCSLSKDYFWFQFLLSSRGYLKLWWRC
jgi:hypothetical protein